MAKHSSNISREKVKAILKNRSLVAKARGGSAEESSLFTEEDISVLLNELNIVQFELEMQNNELKLSYDTIDAERLKFADLYDHAPIGYFILDHLGIIEEVNQTGLDLLGSSKTSIRNRRFQSFIVPTDLEKFYSFLNKMLDSNKKISAELKITLPDQQFLYTRVEGTVIPNYAASNIKYYITVIDITESKRAQQLLKETKERLEMTLKASSTGIWSIEFGSENIILDENSYKILDLSPWAFNGSLKNFFSLIHPDDQSKVRYNYMHSLNYSREIDIDFRIITHDGTIRTIATKGQKMTVSDDRQFFAGILMDITEKVKLTNEAETLRVEQQRAVLAATMDAQESERAKLSRALHDSVCQILYGIRLNLQSIDYYRNHKDEFVNVNQLLDQAIKETRQISYELTPSVLKDFGFSAGIKEMVSRLSTPQFVVKTNIRKSIDNVNPTIQLYAFRMIQELVNNCIKHSKATKAEITAYMHADIITIVVADNGRGFKTDLEYALRNGSGLRGIKNQLFLLNGEIDFNISQTGTTVTITFNTIIDV